LACHAGRLFMQFCHEQITPKSVEGYTSTRPARGRGGLRTDLLPGIQDNFRGSYFSPGISSPEMATGFLSHMLAHPAVYSVVAEMDGRVVGSNFMWEFQPIAGIGPITVDPAAQNGSVGRRLMEDALARCKTQHFVGVRLVQAAFHNRSLSLYTKLGFNVCEPLAVFQGPALGFKNRGARCPAPQKRTWRRANRVCFKCMA